MNDLQTYWLYDDDEVIYAVRLPIEATDEEVRACALRWFNRVPLPRLGEPPYVTERRIRRAEVRT